MQETLEIHPNNPAPEGAVAGMVETPDGVRLRYARFEAHKPPTKGTVLLLHGRSEYIEKLFETIEDLRQRGFAVLTFDWRGQGGSDRLLADFRKGYIDDFAQYVTDLETIMQEVALPDCRAPYFVFAHSTGGLVALLAAPGFGNRFRRMVLCAPLIQFASRQISQSITQYIATALTICGFGEAYMGSGGTPPDSRPFAGNRVTSDTKRFDRNESFAATFRHLTIGGPTASWVAAACRAMDTIGSPEHMARIKIPTLLIAAGADKVVSVGVSEEYGQHMRSGSTITIDGAKHEIMQERDVFRDQLLEAFATFVPGTDPL